MLSHSTWQTEKTLLPDKGLCKYRHCGGSSLVATGPYQCAVTFLKEMNTHHNTGSFYVCYATHTSQANTALCSLGRMPSKEEGELCFGVSPSPTTERGWQTFCFQGSQSCQSCSFQSKSQVTETHKIYQFQAARDTLSPQLPSSNGTWFLCLPLEGWKRCPISVLYLFTLTIKEDFCSLGQGCAGRTAPRYETEE